MRALRIPAIAASILASVSITVAVPSNDEIQKILAERIGKSDGDIGIIVGVIEPQGRRIVSLGHRKSGDSEPLNGDTVFEIGSVTKVFTALLLADMVGKNEVALNDAAAKYLPPDIKVPSRNGRVITVVDLATHTSGLPFMPENAPPLNDPAAAKYSVADLKRYVANYKLKRDIGSEWDYSNIGYWILSEALSLRAGEGFENLVRKRVIAPLNLTNTDFALSPQMKADLAVGHDAALQSAPDVSTLGVYSIMPAAGGLYSTTNDLLKIVSVAMGYEQSPLSPAIKTMVKTRRPASGASEQALAWTIVGNSEDPVIFRDGGTFGFASSIAWDPKKRVGVVVLSNQQGDVNDIARHLLQPDFPIAKPGNVKHTEIALGAALLDRYTGRFEALGEGIFTIARESNFLTIESPADWGLPKLRIRPESQRHFFASELPLRVTFKIDNDNRVTGLLIYPPRGQKAVPANRLSLGRYR